MIRRSFILALIVPSCCVTVLTQTQFSTYTGISGYWDYQVSYRTPQYIRACPGSSMIHAIMMVADDSLNTSASRRTAYAFSSDAGTTWTTFNQVRVPDRKSGYPSLDIGQASLGCDPIISNHGIVGTTLQSSIYVGDPPGTGVFTEIDASLAFGGSDEPVFAEVAGSANGSVVLLGSRLAAGTSHYTQTPDFISWLPWGVLTPDLVSDGFVAEANSKGGQELESVGSPFGALFHGSNRRTMDRHGHRPQWRSCPQKYPWAPTRSLSFKDSILRTQPATRSSPSEPPSSLKATRHLATTASDSGVSQRGSSSLCRTIQFRVLWIPCSSIR